MVSEILAVAVDEIVGELGVEAFACTLPTIVHDSTDLSCALESRTASGTNRNTSVDLWLLSTASGVVRFRRAFIGTR